MYQIKLTDAQYRDLYFALLIAEKNARAEAMNMECLGLTVASNEIKADANRYKDLLWYVTNRKEVI